MEQFFVYATTIILGALLFGLLFYSFYIVLTSKDKTSEKQTGEDSAVITNTTVSHKEQPAISNKTKSPNPKNQPPKKSHKNKKGTRKAA